MGDEERRDNAEKQDQMKDQEPFREDPRGRQEVSDQQAETQPSEERERDGGGAPPPPREDEDPAGQTGRDNAGEATGSPPNAG